MRLCEDNFDWVVHLRGHVTGPIHRHGVSVWSYEVVNTYLDRVVGGDDAYSLDQAMDGAALEVYLARAAWFFSFRKHDLRRKGKVDD